MTEAVDYNVASGGNLSSSGTWTASTSIDIVDDNLTYAGLADPTVTYNKKIHATASGGSGTKEFHTAAISSGSVYVSFLLKVPALPSTGGGSVIGLDDDGTLTTSGAHMAAALVVHIRRHPSITTAYEIGIRKGQGTGAGGGTASFYTATNFTTGDTVLVVAQYTFEAGAGDDTVTLWVTPSSLGAVEPAASITATTTGNTVDAASLRYVALKSNSSSNTGTPQIDNIRVGSIWADVTPSSGGGCTPPTINTQPTAQADCEGEEVEFSVAATGTTLTYQWRKNGVNLSNGGNISGTTTATLTINPVGTGDAATAGAGYDCVVTESATCSTTSTRVALTVNTPPSITDQPDNATVAVGAEANFAVTATGAGIAYQWQVDAGGGFADVTDGSGADTASYTPETTTIGMNTYQYRCVVSGTCSPAATSDPATLTVTSCTEAGVVADPVNQSVTSPATATFTVTATGSDPTYQWELSTDSGNSWDPVSDGTGGTTASYTTAATTGAMNDYQYRCVVSVACDDSSAPSQAATLTVNCESATVTADPENAIAGLGATANFTVIASGSPTMSYQWEVSTNDGETWNNVLGGSGGTSASYTTAATTLDDDGNQYRCVVTSSCDSSTDTSAAATLTVVDPATVQFRSAQTGNWDEASTWEVFVSSIWEAASASPTSDNDTITIRDGHVVTVAANVTADQITVASGGTLSVTGSSTKLTVADGAGTDLEISGTLDITGGASAVTLADDASVVIQDGGLIMHNGSSSGFVSAGSGSTITFASGAKYQHLRNGGRIPLSIWNTGSTCEVVVSLSDPSSLDAAFLGQEFHHFVWTSTTQTSDEDLRGALTTINGDLTISANAGKVRLNSSSGTSTLTVGGNVSVNTGTLNCNSTTTLVGMNVGGNFTIASGATIDVSGGTTYSINFDGSGPQTWTMAGTILNATRYAWKIDSGSVVSLGGTVTVNSGSQVGSITVDGTLELETGSVIGGTGTFTLNPGSTLAGEGTVNFATTVNGTVAPGASIGTLNFGSSLAVAATAVAEMELGDAPAADKADATGAVTYAGTLKLIWTGTSLSASDTFDLFDGSGFSGAFTGLELVNWPSPALRVDLGSLTADGSISITANAAPTASDMALGVATGGNNSIALAKLLLNTDDANGDPLSLSIGTPTHGTAEIAGGNLTYTHNGNTATSDSFSFTVADPSGATATASILVTITPATGSGANIIQLTGTVPNMTVHFAGMPESTYAIDRSEDLSNWEELSTSVGTASNGFGSYTDTSAPSASAYYRTRYLSTP